MHEPECAMTHDISNPGSPNPYNETPCSSNIELFEESQDMPAQVSPVAVHPQAKKKKLTAKDVQQMQVEVLVLEKQKIKMEVENLKLANEKIRLEIKKLLE